MQMGFIYYGKKPSYILFDTEEKVYFSDIKADARKAGRSIPMPEAKTAMDILTVGYTLVRSGYQKETSPAKAKAIFGD